MDDAHRAKLPKPEAGEDTSEFDKMVVGGMYAASDPYVQKIAGIESAKVKAINACQDSAEKNRFLREFMHIGQDVDFYWITPFFAEYVSGKYAASRRLLNIIRS